MTKIQQIKHQKSMDYWKQLVIAQQQSGLSVTEYCRQQDIKYNAFYYWLRKIREEALESLPQLPEKNTINPQFAVLSATTVTAAVLFCGRRKDRIKGLLWDETGFLLIYKRLENGQYQWPDTPEDLLEISEQQLRWLTEDLSISQPKAVQKVSPAYSF